MKATVATLASSMKSSTVDDPCPTRKLGNVIYVFPGAPLSGGTAVIPASVFVSAIA